MVGIGIHGGLKILCSKERVGSNPTTPIVAMARGVTVSTLLL